MGRWQSVSEVIEPGRVVRLQVYADDEVMSFAEVFDGWRTDKLFRTFFNQRLADMPFAAFFLECHPVTSTTSGQPFECVCVDAPLLASVKADGRPFADKFSDPAPDEGIATFTSLGGDAILIAPGAAAEASSYPHLAAFVRTAPAAQRDALWRDVAIAVQARLDASPLWLSTSGLGVYWLHVRLDTRPKYYTHRPYREVAGPAHA